MTQEIIDAQTLFKDVVIDNGLRFSSDFSFENAVWYYVPLMMRMHREIWYEEYLVCFYFDIGCGEIYGRLGRRGHFHLEPIQSLNEIADKFRSICNVIGMDPYPDELLPKYYVIEPSHFRRIIDLLIFS